MKNIILYLHSIWLRENGVMNVNWMKRVERKQAFDEVKRGSVSVPIAKQGSS